MGFIYEGLAGLESVSIFVYFLVLLGGILSAVSVCYIPILIMFGGYMSGHSKEGMGKAIRITWSFVFGMMITSAIIGVIAAFVGKAIMKVFVSYGLDLWIPVIFVGKAIMKVFVSYGLDLWIPVIVGIVMGLQLLGVIHLKMPKTFAVKGRKPNTSMSAFTLGLPFGLVITPCTIPIFVMVITYVATQGDMLHGALLLTTYAIGKGIVLTIVAVTSTTFLKDISVKWSGLIEKIAGAIILLATLFLVIYQKFLY